MTSEPPAAWNRSTYASIRPAVVVERDVGQEAGRVGPQRFEEHAPGGDLRERLPVGRARDRDRDRARRTVPGQPDHPYVVAEVPPAELRPDAELPGQLEDLGLQGQVPEPLRRDGSLGGQ